MATSVRRSNTYCFVYDCSTVNSAKNKIIFHSLPKEKRTAVRFISKTETKETVDCRWAWTMKLRMNSVYLKKTQINIRSNNFTEDDYTLSGYFYLILNFNLKIPIILF